MDSRQRLHATLGDDGTCRPPRYESEFSPEVVQAWRGQGVLDERSPEKFFGFDPRESLDIRWRRHRRDGGVLVDTEEGLEALRRAFDPEDPNKFPADWDARVSGWRGRDFPVFASPWNEGFFQAIGISNGESLNRAFVGLCEKPALAQAAMDHYAHYTESLLDRALAEVELDYVVLYEPIASNHGPVVSPETYRRFVLPGLRRVVQCLEGHGVAFRFLWAAGQVEALIPLWLEAGMNGLILNQAGQAGIAYRALRTKYGDELRLFGGVDWRAVVQGPEAIDAFLEEEVRPTLEEGRYVPYLDDTIRVYMPFDHFTYYRQRLDALMDEVFGLE